jgi:hypothetical protein
MKEQGLLRRARCPVLMNREAVSLFGLGRIFYGKPVRIPDQVRDRPFPENALAAAA